MSNIENIAQVVEIKSKSSLVVRINVNSACDACHIKSKCANLSCESTTKDIEINNIVSDNYQLGEKVIVFYSNKTGAFVVFLSYIIPVIVCVLSLIISLYLGFNEGLSALISLIVIVLYFIILYIFGRKLKVKLDVGIEKIKEY